MGTNSHRARARRALSEDEEAVEQVGVQIDESVLTSVPAASMALDESGFASLVSAGTEVSGDFRCTECGYGAVVRSVLPPCPMCGGTVWQSLELRAGLVG